MRFAMKFRISHVRALRNPSVLCVFVFLFNAKGAMLSQRTPFNSLYLMRSVFNTY
jgi:hypothetical protein